MRNYLCLLGTSIFIIYTSCTYADKNYEIPKSNFHTQQNLPDSIIFPSIFNEQYVSFRYVDFGCFHYATELMQITKFKDRYQISIVYNDEKGINKPNVGVYEIEDSIFLNCLTNFMIDCEKRIKKNNSDLVPTTFSTSGKFLEVRDGLHSLSISLSNCNSYYNPYLVLRLYVMHAGTLKSKNAG